MPRVLRAAWLAAAAAGSGSSILTTAAVPRLSNDAGPQQVHLAYGLDPNTVSVMWASTSAAATAKHTVAFGPAGSGNFSAVAVGDTRPLKLAGSGDRDTHVAVLAGIEDGASYDYKVLQDDPAAESEVFTFKYRKQHDASRPDVHIIFGDLGASHGFSLCTGCSFLSTTCDAATCAANTSVGLVSEVGEADMFLHVGDFAYNFDSAEGRTGDQFMRNIEQVAARVPYMTSIGNHENGGANLAHYIERFRGMPSNTTPMTTQAGTTTNSLYYSWDAGLVHYIALSTELWFGEGVPGEVDRETQLAWLEQDLKAANANRDAVPWIIAHGHRDIYCSTDDDSDCNNATTGDAGRVRVDLEPLFFKYGLDFWINGHEHSYERTYPVYQGLSDRNNTDPKATIYIVTGAAGSQEMHEGFTKTPPTWSAFRSNTFGYSRMSVHNATHVHWEQVQTDPTLFPKSDYGRVIDDVWVVQHKHGPFDPARAPKGHAFPKHHDSPKRTLDHWAELLDIGYNGTVALSTLIQQFRDEHGDDAWGAKEAQLMRHVNHLTNSGGKTVWEDVRDNGGSDGEYFRWLEKHPHSAGAAP